MPCLLDLRSPFSCCYFNTQHPSPSPFVVHLTLAPERCERVSGAASTRAWVRVRVHTPKELSESAMYTGQGAACTSAAHQRCSKKAEGRRT